MRRDWDLVRTILFRLEELQPGEDLRAEAVEGYDSRVVAYHMQMLEDQGLIRGIDASTNAARAYIADELTWEGHELLDEIRSDSVWNEVKSGAKSKGVDLTIEVIKALAKEYIKRHLGIDL